MKNEIERLFSPPLLLFQRVMCLTYNLHRGNEKVSSTMKEIYYSLHEYGEKAPITLTDSFEMEKMQFRFSQSALSDSVTV